MPAPRGLLSEQIHTPGNSYDAKYRGWGQIFGSNPQECAGGMVMDEIDTCIIEIIFWTQSKQCGQWLMQVTISSITFPPPPPAHPKIFSQKIAPSWGSGTLAFAQGAGICWGSSQGEGIGL